MSWSDYLADDIRMQEAKLKGVQPSSLSGHENRIQFDHDAELSYQKREEIEEAAKWCIEASPHEFKFLRTIRDILLKREESLAKHGLAGTSIKPQSALEVLSPKQSLRLLECYEREMLNDPEAWAVKNEKGVYGRAAIRKLNKIKRRKEREALQAKIRDDLRNAVKT